MAREAVDMAHMKEKRLPPIHPGEVLQNLLHEAGLTPNAVALALCVPPNRIGGILKGHRGITGDTALRLARYFRHFCPDVDEPAVEIRFGRRAADCHDS
jgi:addiction module HigA family antidote